MVILRKELKTSTSLVNVTLPMEKSLPVAHIGGYSILIFGEKKIGKTSLSSQFPDVLFLMFEAGSKKLSVYQRTVNHWIEFKEYINLILKTDKFKTIIIDPIDKAYDLCFKYVCTKLVISHPADEGWGKGWDAIRSEFNFEMDRLLKSDKGIIFLSHSKEMEIEERSGKKYHRITNTMKGQAKECIEGAVDVWAHYGYEGKQRVLTILGDDRIDAGHRLNEPPGPRFLYTNGEPIRQISMGSTSKEAYGNFIKAFSNQLAEERRESNTVTKKIKLRIKR